MRALASPLLLLGAAAMMAAARPAFPEVLAQVVPAKYNLTVSVNFQNIFNHVNLATPVGNLSSPLFGLSNGLAGQPFSQSTSNRRIDLQASFNF